MQSNNKCPPNDNKCAALKVAVAMGNPKEFINRIVNKKVQDVNDSALKSFEKLKTGVKTCVNTGVIEGVREGVKAATEFYPRMTTATGIAFAGAITEISKSLSEAIRTASADVILANSTTLPHYFPNIFPPLVVLLAGFGLKIKSAINTILLGKNGNEILKDPKNTPKQLWEAVSNNSEIFKKLSEDPEFKAKFHDLISTFTLSALNTIDIAQPELDKIKIKLVEIVTNLTNKTGATFANVILGVVKVIPILGNAISIADSLSNSGTKMVQKIINSSDDPAATAAAVDCLAEGNIKKIKKEVEKFEHNIGSIIARVSSNTRESPEHSPGASQTDVQNSPVYSAYVPESPEYSPGASQPYVQIPPVYSDNVPVYPKKDKYGQNYPEYSAYVPKQRSPEYATFLSTVGNEQLKGGGNNNNKISGRRGRTICTKRVIRKHRPNSVTIKETCNRINRFIKLHRL